MTISSAASNTIWICHTHNGSLRFSYKYVFFLENKTFRNDFSKVYGLDTYVCNVDATLDADFNVDQLILSSDN